MVGGVVLPRCTVSTHSGCLGLLDSAVPSCQVAVPTRSTLSEISPAQPASGEGK
jgi:hypothetical protein